MLADCLRHGLVDVVVPAGGGLRERNRAALLEAEKVPMPEDVLEDLVVAAEAAALEPRLWAGAMQLGGLQECGVFGRAKQRRRVALAAKRRAGLDLHHTRVDRGAAEAAGDRHAGLPVDPVVLAAHPGSIRRRQVIPPT